MIDDEVRKIINDCYATTEAMIRKNKDLLAKIVAALLEKETLDASEFNSFFDK